MVLTQHLVIALRCCGKWLSAEWRARVLRLWPKVWLWCEGPRAC